MNGKKYIFKQGLSVRGLLVELQADSKFSYLKKSTIPSCIVVLRGQIIAHDQYFNTFIDDGDEIQVLPIIIGG